MNKRVLSYLGASALALTFITTGLVGGTLAKYTTDVKGTATAKVAKFAFDLNGSTQNSSTQTLNLDDLFSTAYNGDKVKGSADVVAPGTSGKIKLRLKNNGEVAIKPTFKITETNAGSIPIQYAVSADGTAPAAADWKTAADLNSSGLAAQEVAVGGADETFYLHWRWSTASPDAADTALGSATTSATVKLDISCTVEQVIN